MKNKIIEIISVNKSNNFVGIKTGEGSVQLYVPSVFRQDENIKKDILIFIKSISIAKKLHQDKIQNGKNVNDKIWPIDSYLWIIRDYLDNGCYYNREKRYSNSNSGKIDWKRTLRNMPIYSNGNIIYDKFVTSKMSATNDIIAQTYRLCLKQALQRIGWLFNYNFYVEIQQIFSISEMVAEIRRELNQTFDDVKNLRYKHMLKILRNTEGEKVASSICSYGITNYHYVFETMVDMIFDGITEEKSNYNPNGYWKLNNKKPKKASSLMPDTILKRDDKTYILDAKMYQYGATHDVSKLPNTQSLQKQITYGDYVHNNLGDQFVRNAFILPYNKELESFKKDKNLIRYYDDNLVYFGYAYVDWRTDNKEDYDYIHTFGIDFNYLLRNYNLHDYKLINNLILSIEDRLKFIKENEE